MIASISVDVDTLKDYAYTYGFFYRSSPDPIYTLGVPRVLSLMKSLNLKGTFFVIGRDLAIPKHLRIIKNIQTDKHEIANHTQNHLHEFDKLSISEQAEEIEQCHQIVFRKLKIKMNGFRAPGYNIHKSSLAVLKKLEYEYESSSFPTSLLPIMKILITSKAKSRQRVNSGGNLLNMFAKSTPYKIPEENLNELPISTTPILRLPFMGTFSVNTGMPLLKVSYKSIKVLKRPINYEIHPMDLLEFKKDNLPKAFKIHPGITLPLEHKMNLYTWLFKALKQDYSVRTLIKQSQLINENSLSNI